MTAVATEPGSRPSSVTASVEMRLTMRYGPHCISTWLMTVSEMTLVTIPVRWFRALRRPEPRSRRPSSLPASTNVAASSAPSTTRAPPASLRSDRRPCSTHRRTVSSLTLSSAAASLILMRPMRRQCRRGRPEVHRIYGTNRQIAPRMRIWSVRWFGCALIVESRARLTTPGGDHSGRRCARRPRRRPAA
jgi:hypothetical protein